MSDVAVVDIRAKCESRLCASCQLCVLSFHPMSEDIEIADGPNAECVISSICEVAIVPLNLGR